MKFAARMLGTGSAHPAKRLTNEDIAHIISEFGAETNDRWIQDRTGISERRVTHTLPSEMAYVAGARALACADLPAGQLELIIYGSCTNDEQVPNSASGVQFRLEAVNAASMDVNTACTSPSGGNQSQDESCPDES